MFDKIGNLLNKSRNRFYARLTYQHVLDSVGITHSQIRSSTKLKNLIEKKSEACEQARRIDCVGISSVLGKYRLYENPGEECKKMSASTLQEFDFYFDLEPAAKDVFNGKSPISILPAAIYDEQCDMLGISISLTTGEIQNGHEINLNSTKNKIRHIVNRVKRDYEEGHCSDLAYFAWNTIMLRFFMLTRKSNQVDDTVALLIKLMQTSEVQTHLKHYNNQQEYLFWFYALIENWSTHGNSAVYSPQYAEEMPNKNEFYAEPQIIIRKALDYMLSDYAQDRNDNPISKKQKILKRLFSKLTVSKTAKFIENKAALWLPNEHYIADRAASKIYPAKTTRRMLLNGRVETSKKMRIFNQVMWLTITGLILFFLFFSLAFLTRQMPVFLGASLFCLAASITLFRHVNKTLKKAVPNSAYTLIDMMLTRFKVS